MKLLFVDSSRMGWGTEQHFVEMVTELVTELPAQVDPRIPVAGLLEVPRGPSVPP
jgi:hypothetical protein